MLISVCIQGIHDAIGFGIEKFHHHTVVRRHPHASVTIVIADRDNFADIKTEEIVYPGNNRFIKSHPLSAINSKFSTVGVSRIGRQLGGHGVLSDIFSSAGGDGSQFLNITAIFIH